MLQAEAAEAAKLVRAAERAANMALPEKDRSPYYSQEVRDKISEGLRKRWRDPAYRASRNYTTSNATRLKLSKAMKAKWQDGAFRKRNTINGTHHSPERRAKIAESVKRKWALDSDYRNRTVEAIRRSRNITMKRREQDPAAHAAWKSKISKSMKARWQEDEFRADRLSAFAEGQGKRAITRSINAASGSIPIVARPAAPRKPRATAAETAAKRKETSAAKRRRLDIATRKREEATAVRQNAKSNAGFEDRLRAAMGVGAPWSPPGSDGAAAPKPVAPPAPAPAPAAVAEEEEEEEEEERGEGLASPEEEPHSEELAFEDEEIGEVPARLPACMPQAACLPPLLSCSRRLSHPQPEPARPSPHANSPTRAPSRRHTPNLTPRPSLPCPAPRPSLLAPLLLAPTAPHFDVCAPHHPFPRDHPERRRGRQWRAAGGRARQGTACRERQWRRWRRRRRRRWHQRERSEQQRSLVGRLRARAGLGDLVPHVELSVHVPPTHATHMPRTCRPHAMHISSQGIEFPVDANEDSADSAESFDKIEHWMDGGA